MGISRGPRRRCVLPEVTARRLGGYPKRAAMVEAWEFADLSRQDSPTSSDAGVSCALRVYKPVRSPAGHWLACGAALSCTVAEQEVRHVPIVCS